MSLKNFLLEKDWSTDSAELMRRLCPHAKCVPAFDPIAAEGLSVEQVRLRYPRFDGVCPDCNSHLIMYYSEEHFVSGDW